ncbi:luciferin 4-monooxygenase-like [Ixodes scapularis]|uniref:luciferin 4-monooxygenase-like n=1 Tax=Ixodes scapularis TaxID=6945 RepID=UPI001C38068D|nr:luciferin 4-monooxygenase-like [Ixodes scapularis]
MRFLGQVGHQQNYQLMHRHIVEKRREVLLVGTKVNLNWLYEVKMFLKVLVSQGCFTTGTAPGFVSVTEFKKLDENSYEEFVVENVKDEVAVLGYSSGTTGIPKAIELTHMSLMPSLPCPGLHNLYNDQDIVVFRVPITSSSGYRTFLRTWASGTTIVLLPKTASTTEVLDAITKNKATAVLGNSTMMLELAKKIQEKGIRLDSVKKVFLGGTTATYETMRQIEQSFDLAIIRNVYGSTETGEICTPPMDASKWYGIGFPAPNVQIKIVDVKTGDVLGPNEKGMALVKTPRAMKGYYGNPEATSKTIIDGWVQTGDILYYNEDGHFFFVERTIHVFWCMGIRVAPSSIERVLLSHEGIADAAVIGVPHPEYLKVAKAFVVLKKPSSEITEEKLKIFVAGQVRPHMHLHGGVKIVEKIPQNGLGKVNKKQLELLH